MNKKLLLILLLLGAIVASSMVGTLSSYAAQTTFGVDIVIK